MKQIFCLLITLVLLASCGKGDVIIPDPHAATQKLLMAHTWVVDTDVNIINGVRNTYENYFNDRRIMVFSSTTYTYNVYHNGASEGDAINNYKLGDQTIYMPGL